jgi:hypothetical protein
MYRVSVTWPAHANRASDARFTITSGNRSVTKVINPRQWPQSCHDAFQASDGSRSHWFADLASPFQTDGNTLTVTLESSTTGYAIADAVRLERLAWPDYDVQADGQWVQNGQSTVDFGTALLGLPHVTRPPQGQSVRAHHRREAPGSDAS